MERHTKTMSKWDRFKMKMRVCRNILFSSRRYWVLISMNEDQKEKFDTKFNDAYENFDVRIDHHGLDKKETMHLIKDVHFGYADRSLRIDPLHKREERKRNKQQLVNN